MLEGLLVREPSPHPVKLRIYPDTSVIGGCEDEEFRVDVPFPPIDEQQHIAQAVDRAMDQIAASIERSRRQIGSLREYRARLIADVVTGKLDVREAAAGLPETDSRGAEDDPAYSVDHDADPSETTTGS